jgi:hypothetical protein
MDHLKLLGYTHDSSAGICTGNSADCGGKNHYASQISLGTRSQKEKLLNIGPRRSTDLLF